MEQSSCLNPQPLQTDTVVGIQLRSFNFKLSSSILLSK